MFSLLAPAIEVMFFSSLIILGYFKFCVCLFGSLISLFQLSSLLVCQPSCLCDYLFLPDVLHLHPLVSPLSCAYILPHFPVFSARFSSTCVSCSPVFLLTLSSSHVLSFFVTLPFCLILFAFWRPLPVFDCGLALCFCTSSSASIKTFLI